MANSGTSAADIAKKYHKQQLKDQKKMEGKQHVTYHRTPTVYQMEVSECGAASLSMILQYYGKYVSLEQMRIETGVSRNGCNAKNVCIAAEKLGLEYTASSRTLERMLLKSETPCILHWNYTHFVVFEGSRFGKYVINDPQRGRVKLTKEELQEGYSGTVLEFKPSDKFKKDGKKRTLFEFMKKRLEGQKATLLALLLMQIALIMPGVLNSVFEQVFLDDILVQNNNTWLKWLLLIMALTAIYNAYFTYINARIKLLLRTKMSLISSDKMIAHLLRLPMDFFEQRFAGDIVSRVQSNASVSEFLAGQLIGTIISLITASVYFVIMLFYSPLLSLVGLSFSVISIIIASFAATKIRFTTLKFSMDTGKLYGALYNGLSASSSLKAVGAENEYTARMLGYYAEVSNNDQKLGRMQTTLSIIPNTLKTLNSVVLLIWGSYYVVNGELSMGMLMAFTGFLASFSKPFEDIVSFVRGIQQIKIDMLRVEDVMNYREEDNYVVEKDESLIGKKLKGEVSLENISFAYGKLDKPFIKNFDFHLVSGRTVALVGASGCGKSTIAKMVSCLYRPWTGDILLDGIELEKIPQEVISSSISVVTQTISLFDGTIYDNIAGWNSVISEEDVIQAAKDACLHDEITMKQGAYDFRLSENGANLSGGQRQRVEIAKALAINPTILVMDEATSALDTATEKQILDNIKRRHCTCVIVAQRLSTIRDCDEIIVLDHGVIKERGTHEELMSKKNGMYYNLIKEAN
ncbi:MAG: NHLP family bacteriocin export ABC transporter peptidase/permease/ATPase subunit [Lachnospiraceae bacterium]|nr:NHLP family bacteriocin export ABC transporter peptidase/permease/ATPase subunit [Lachnospiraceae bacterium]